MNQIIKVNNFTIIYNHFPKSKTTLVEAYVNNGSFMKIIKILEYHIY